MCTCREISNEYDARQELTVEQFDNMVRLIDDTIHHDDVVRYLGVFTSEDEAIEHFLVEEGGLNSALMDEEVVSINRSAALDHMEYVYDAYVLTDSDLDDDTFFLVQINS